MMKINSNTFLPVNPQLSVSNYELNELGDVAQLTMSAASMLTIEARGTFTATMVVETSIDGINWISSSVTNAATSSVTASFNAVGRYISYVSTGTMARVRVSAYTSGTVILVLAETNANNGQMAISNGQFNPISVVQTTRLCTGRQTVSVTTGAVTTISPIAGSAACTIQADGTSVSITLDGTTPTATIGSRIDDGIFYYVDTTLSTIKLIARVATTNVQIEYFNRV